MRPTVENFFHIVERRNNSISCVLCHSWSEEFRDTTLLLQLNKDSSKVHTSSRLWSTSWIKFEQQLKHLIRNKVQAMTTRVTQETTWIYLNNYASHGGLPPPSPWLLQLDWYLFNLSTSRVPTDHLMGFRCLTWQQRQQQQFSSKAIPLDRATCKWKLSNNYC